MKRGDRRRIPGDESPKTRLFARGTDGSKPAPSTSESAANLDFLDQGCARAPRDMHGATGNGSSRPAEPQPQPLHAHASAPPLGRVRTELIPAERASAMTWAMALW